MKNHTKQLAAAIAVASSLATAGSAMAQDYLNGSPTLSNMDPRTFNTAPNVLDANWNPSAAVTTFVSLPIGLEVQSLGYGSMYYQPATPTPLNPNDATATLTLTVNNVTPAQPNVWIGCLLFSMTVWVIQRPTADITGNLAIPPFGQAMF